MFEFDRPISGGAVATISESYMCYRVMPSVKATCVIGLMPSVKAICVVVSFPQGFYGEGHKGILVNCSSIRGW